MSLSRPSVRSPGSSSSFPARQAAEPAVVGIYGLPGSGKTFLLEQLKGILSEKDFAFYEGSKVIADLVPGGLNAFKESPDDERVRWREKAIVSIQEECAKHGQVGVVTGHLMFWSEGKPLGSSVYTQKDFEVYTHILCLDVPAERIVQQRADDKTRVRPPASASHLQLWQDTEKEQLRSLCRENGVLFSVIVPGPSMLQRATAMLYDFKQQSQHFNTTVVEGVLDDAVAAGNDQLQTYLVFDADRTLAAEDTGKLFWQEMSECGHPLTELDPLKILFSGPLEYSYTAFRQATLLYEDILDDDAFEETCEKIASTINIYPEIVSMLQKVAHFEHVGAVIVTCGLRSVWDKVLARHGLSDTVKVIGGGRIADGLVVTADVKSTLVQRLQNVHGLYVWSFGDSPLDLQMLAVANHALIMVGEEQHRSSTMDELLYKTIKDHGLVASQVLMPKYASPRLNTKDLPVVDLTDSGLLHAIFSRRDARPAKLKLFHSTHHMATKLLMTPMRDANVAGPALRRAHHDVGRYLALEHLPEIIGLETYQTRHVQGHMMDGYRFRHESKTLIIALMRGGEPMAFGVNDALPLASFLHAKEAVDVKEHHLHDKHTVLLVDSVVNSGKSILEFVDHINQLRVPVHIVIVAGVVQAGFVSQSNPFGNLGLLSDVSLVALRLSENKFKGQGGTDTGNRLFNTTHLD